MKVMELRGLGAVRDDFIKYLGPIIGAQNAANAYDKGIAEIRSQAEAGAKKGVAAEIPNIKAQVYDEAKSSVTPIVIGGIAVAGVAAALSISAMIVAVARTRRA